MNSDMAAMLKSMVSVPSILYRHMVYMQGTFLGRVRLFWVEHVFLDKHLFLLQVKKKMNVVCAAAAMGNFFKM